MRPKGKLFALFAVFAAIGLVTASGAFTSVEADRTAEVNVAGDADALLALEPAEAGGSDTENADEYVDTSGDTVSINLANSSAASGSTGINQNALTEADRVLNITNQGSQSANLSVTLADNDDQDEVGNTETPSDYITVYADDGSETNLTSSSKELAPGETVYIHIEIDTRDQALTTGDDILDEITFVADQTE